MRLAFICSVGTGLLKVDLNLAIAWLKMEILGPVKEPYGSRGTYIHVDDIRPRQSLAMDALFQIL